MNPFHRTPDLTPYRTADFPRTAGPEAGSGLVCLGYFRLFDHLRACRVHPQSPPESCLANLVRKLARKYDLNEPSQVGVEYQLAWLVKQLPSPFGAGGPTWALALEYTHRVATKPATGKSQQPWPSWPKLTVEQGLVLLARTSRGQYFASRNVIAYDLQKWLSTGFAWFTPVLPEQEVPR